MRKLSVLLLSAAFALSANTSSAQDITVPDTHKSLVCKWTADWCVYCGLWGWEVTEELVDLSNSGDLDAIVVAVHASGSSQSHFNINDKFYKIKQNLTSQPSGIPSFSVSNKLINTGGAAGPIKNSVGKETVDPAEVNAGFMPTWVDDGTLKVDVKTKFLAEAAGTFSVGIYFYENDVEGTQTGKSGKVKHHNVLRTPDCDMESGFGNEIPGTNFKAGDVFNHTFTFDILAKWNQENLVPFSIVWKQNDKNKWEVANASSVPTWPTSVGSVNGNVVAGIYPNPINDKFVVAISQPFNTCNITMTDVSGKKVADLYSGAIAKNAVAISLDRPQNLANGVYFINIVSDKGTQSVKVMLQ